jgi:hypothetical protein
MREVEGVEGVEGVEVRLKFLEENLKQMFQVAVAQLVP